MLIHSETIDYRTTEQLDDWLYEWAKNYAEKHDVRYVAHTTAANAHGRVIGSILFEHGWDQPWTYSFYAAPTHHWVAGEHPEQWHVEVSGDPLGQDPADIAAHAVRTAINTALDR